ncbi:MAG: hypothetical protein HQL39_19570 [Alphaproteobacteria bacterium]|nr:hypothetical protein [Alphaproteobacteria bacterium]
MGIVEDWAIGGVPACHEQVSRLERPAPPILVAGFGVKVLDLLVGDLDHRAAWVGAQPALVLAQSLSQGVIAVSAIVPQRPPSVGASKLGMDSA